MIKHIFIFCFILLASATSLTCQQTDTLNIFYSINEAGLNITNKKILNDFVKDKDIIDIKIYGYSDFLGTKEQNIILSQKRADNVKSYLINLELNSSTISECKGLGIHKFSTIENRTNPEDRGIMHHRKVSIIASYYDMHNTIEKIEDEVEEEDDDEEKPVVIPIFKEIDIEDYEAGSTIVFQNILFHGGSHRVKEESMPALYQLLRLMQQNSSLKIQIDGHICCHDGPGDGYDIDAKDYNLSTNRAKAVYDFLIKNGISEDRMSYFGYSSMYRLYPEERTWKEEDLNRRVEIVIVEK